MMNLTEKLPRSIKIDGVEYPVNTDFRIMAGFEAKITAADISDKKEFIKIFIEIISKLFIEIPRADIDKIIEGVMWFYRCGKAPENKSGNSSRTKRCYDHSEDADYIYAAFAQQYGDDLVNSKMHWWEFRAKFLGLTDSTEFVKIMQYRCTDISKIKNKDERARLKRLQEHYALKENRIKFADAAHRQADMRERLKKRFAFARRFYYFRKGDIMGEDSKIVVKIDGDNSGLKNSLKETEQGLKNVGGNAETAEKPVEKLSEKIKKTGDSGKDIDETADKVKKIGDNAESSQKQVITLGDLIKSNLISDVIKRGLDEVSDKIGDFIRSGVEMASDLQEVQNVVDTTFGSGAGKIYEWADAAAESFGMSSLQAQKYNGILGAMMKSMGLTDDAVLKMSTDMVGLAGDMASFYNLNVEETFEKIRSGISGETEPLKQLGINMSVANLEAFALANGIETAYDKMSQAEQATLRYNYLMAQTADAQGDFAKTSDSFANQQRILQLQINELSASLGEKLLPYLNDVLITINDDLPEISEKADELFSRIGDGIDWIMDNGDLVIGIIEGLAVSFGTLTAAAKLGNLIDGIKKFKDVAAGAGAALNPLLIAFAALTAAALAAKGAIDNYTGSMDVSHIDDQTKAIMDETEAIKEQKREYDELIEKKNENIESDLAEANNIKRLWTELQNYTDESGKVYKERERANEIISLLNENYGLNIGYIDDQIQGYQELASSMDDYIEKLRIESRIRNGQEAYDEAVKNYDELIKKRDELQDSLKSYEQNVANYEELYRSGNYDESNKDDIFDQLGDAYAQRSAVQEQIDNINELISTEQKEMEEYESLFEEKNKLADTSAVDGGTGSGVDSDKTDLEKYEEKLQAEEDLLEHSLKTRNITAEQYDQQLMEKLNSDLGFDNAEELKKDSELYYQLLEKHEDYIEDKKTADEKAAEDAREAAEKQTKTELDEIKRCHEAKADETDYAAEAAELENKLIEKGCDRNSDTWSSYFDTVDDLRKKADEKSQKELENSLKEQQKTIDKELDKIIKKYDEQYKQLENLQSDYKKKLMSIGGDLFSVEEIENEDGSKTKKYIVNDLDEQLAAMQKYHAQVKKLKEQGASNELLSELFSLGDEDGKIFADKLSNMSEQEFSKINELYSEKQRLADELSEDLYKSDAEKISAAVENELENLANKGDVLGKEAAEIYAEAFKNELAEQFDKLEEIFGDTEFTSNLKAMVESEAAASVPAAAYGGTVINNNVTNQSENNSLFSRVFDEFFSNLNKPIQITLDGKIIGESVLNYSGNKKRSTGT